MATINASDILDQRPLPIDARDICTKVTLVVAGRPSGRAPDIAAQIMEDETGALIDRQFVTHYPRPIVYEYEATEHATFAAHKVFQLPADAYPFLPPTSDEVPGPHHSGSLASLEDPIHDGDPDTAAVISGANDNAVWLQYTLSSGDGNQRIVGWRLMYWMDIFQNSDPPINILAQLSSPRLDGVTGDGLRSVMWHVPQTQDGEEVIVADLWATIHADARQAEADTDFTDVLLWQMPAGGWRVELGLVHFYPLLLDESYLEEIAKSHIKLPASTPQRITVRGVVPVSATHTVDGEELVVARQTFEGGVTIIDFEQAGSPVGVASEAFEAERVRLIREQTARASSLYPLTMGER